MRHLWLIGIVIAVALAAPGAGAQTLEALLDAWGQPVRVVEDAQGVKKLYYPSRNTTWDKYIYYTVVDGAVTGQGFEDWMDADPNGGVLYSRKYYEENPMPVATLKAAWGAPSDERAMGDGTRMLYYPVNNTTADGYHTFLVAGDAVLDRGTAVRPPADTAGSEAGQTPTITEIEKIWGKPVHVVAVEGDASLRYYASNNTTMAAYVYFVVKDGMVVEQGENDWVKAPG